MSDQDQPPKTSKGSAVAMWLDAVDQTSEPYKSQLKELDIHDRRDRMEIEEILDHEVPKEDYGALEDAFHDLWNEFDDVW